MSRVRFDENFIYVRIDVEETLLSQYDLLNTFGNITKSE